MTPRDILDWLFASPKGAPLARIEKARRLAARQRIEWSEVLAAMTPEQRQQVESANG